jgi:DNA helicase II / ATP-dependent DNA helicase PcrA
MTKEYKLKAENSHEIKYAVNYAAELDAQQLAAVCAPNGPNLVIAGAGSGKTHTIIHRVARLIESGVSPDRIMLVTFTNKAADEMTKRAAKLANIDTRQIWGGTFHSIGNRILRQDCALLGYQDNYTFIDPADAKDLLGAVIEDKQINITENRFPETAIIQKIISTSLNTLIPIADLIINDYPYFKQHIQTICSIADGYRDRKLKSNVMDYDDFLTNWLRLLKEYPEHKDHWSRKFEHILVDEYQDTNLLQATIIDQLASYHRNLMVVGDDAQTIYQWRGAHFENIYKFPERYPDAQVFKIETNYRSTPEIVALANESISHNEHQFKKTLVANRQSFGQRPILAPLADEEQQAQFVAGKILELRDEGIPLSEIAVLYRSHRNSAQLEMELNKRNIPYIIRAGYRFMEQAHIKDVVSFLRVIINPRDELAWKRVLKMLPGIGKAKARRIWNQIVVSDDPIRVLRVLATDMGASRKYLEKLADLLNQLYGDGLNGNGPPSPKIELIALSDYKDYLTNQYENAENRLEDINQLAHYAGKFTSTKSFLTDVALVATENGQGERGLSGVDQVSIDSDKEQPLVLSTIHQAKGLQWEAVFLISACEGCFPNPRSLETPEGVEEERRLFYTAITRPENYLHICYPIKFNGYGENIIQRPSRFISELPPELFEIWDVSVQQSSKEAA